MPVFDKFSTKGQKIKHHGTTGGTNILILTEKVLSILGFKKKSMQLMTNENVQSICILQKH